MRSHNINKTNGTKDRVECKKIYSMVFLLLMAIPQLLMKQKLVYKVDPSGIKEIINTRVQLIVLLVTVEALSLLVNYLLVPPIPQVVKPLPVIRSRTTSSATKINSKLTMETTRQLAHQPIQYNKEFGKSSTNYKDGEIEVRH